MKNLLKSFILTGVFAVGLLMINSGEAYAQSDDEWKVPPPVKKIKNPLKETKKNLRMGSVLYDKHCKSCHGKEGKGEGPKSDELDTDPGDFTTKEFQKQTDGELFFKTTEGKDDMKSFKKKMSDEERWQVVMYLRKLETK